MIAFVLSGGANLAAVQVGMLEVLYERGIAPKLLVGTSAGALNAAFVADRPADVDTAAELADIWIGLRRGDLFPVSPLHAILGFGGTRNHLVSDRGVRALAEEYLGARRIEETAVPLHVIAADGRSGEEVRLSEGPLVDAVLASTAIPGILPPVDWDGRELIDGGVANNAPISTAVGLGATTVYVLPAGHACALPATPRGALNMALHAVTLLVHRQLIADTLPACGRPGGLREGAGPDRARAGRRPAVLRRRQAPAAGAADDDARARGSGRGGGATCRGTTRRSVARAVSRPQGLTFRGITPRNVTLCAG